MKKSILNLFGNFSFKTGLFFLSLILALFSVSSISAQDSGRLGEIGDSGGATYGQVAYMTAVHTGLVRSSASYSEAVAALERNGMSLSGKDADSDVDLADLSYLCAKAAGIKGGLMYRLFPCPRYAFFELKSLGILPSSTDPNMKVDGSDVIALLNGCANYRAGEE